MTDITIEKVLKYRKEQELGMLTVDIPRFGTHKAKLEDIYRHTTRSKFFDACIEPENIASIVIFGSTLYNAGPPKTEIIEKRKFGLVGEKIKILKELPHEEPNDLDILILTKKPLHTESRYENGSQYTIEKQDDKTFFKEKLVSASYGRSIHTIYKTLDITQRSVKKFKEYVMSGKDEISLDVFNYGVPLFNTEAFFEILADIPKDTPQRKHYIKWDEDRTGKLSGELLATDTIFDR